MWLWEYVFCVWGELVYNFCDQYKMSLRWEQHASRSYAKTHNEYHSNLKTSLARCVFCFSLMHRKHPRRNRAYWYSCCRVVSQFIPHVIGWFSRHVVNIWFCIQFTDASSCLKFNYYNIQQQAVERYIELWHNVVNIQEATTTKQKATEPYFGFSCAVSKQVANRMY